MANNADGDIYWIPAASVTLDPAAPYPGGGTKYEFAAGAAIPAWQDAAGGWYQKLNDGFWYYHTPITNLGEGGQDNGIWDMRRRWSDADMRQLAPGLTYWARTNDPTDHDGGIDLRMVGAFASIALAGGLLSGSLAPSGASVAAEQAGMDAWLGTDIAIDTTATSAAATTEGVMTVGETGNLSDWLSSYSSDPGVDPFATTADVNAGWSYDGGYSGVDWYNNAGIGEAAAPASSLNDILGSVQKAVSSVGKIFASGSAAVQQTRNNLAQPVPNYTRSAGSMNLGLLAVAAVAWKLL